jgi:small subunit ribosomal protein S9
MNDQERPDDTTDEPQAEEPQAEEAPAEEPQAEEAPAEEPQAEEAPAEEALAEDAATEAPEPAETEPEDAQPAADVAGTGAQATDLPPGAELDPITLEPEREMGAEERARLEAEAEERARLEAEATAEGTDEPLVREGPRVQLPAERIVQATGKRKNSIARVVVRAGGGEFNVNGRKLDEYFPRPHLQTVARQPLVASGYDGTVEVTVRVHGGGVSGQAGAIRHGVARALTEVDPELRGELKRRGLLTRDARIKERRKAGLKKARKRPQFSKR